jgi:hypothetical protein
MESSSLLRAANNTVASKTEVSVPHDAWSSVEQRRSGQSLSVTMPSSCRQSLNEWWILKL